MTEYDKLKKAYKEAMKQGLVKGITWVRSPFSGHQKITVDIGNGVPIMAEGEDARKLLHYIEIF